MEEKVLKLDEVIVDNDLNPRQGALDQDAVLDYSAHIDDLPPMHCYDILGFYYLTRGFHRYAAHRLAMRDDARFVVHQGSREEAKEDADLDNLKHGLRLTRGERREVIRRQLRRHPDWSDSRLAGACGTTDKTVRAIREEMEATSEIPKLDVLTGADGIARPRMMTRQVIEPEPDGRQVTLESAVPVAPALLTPVEILEERQGRESTTPLTDAIMDLPEEEKDLAINDDVVYGAMEQEQIEAGLAEDGEDGSDPDGDLEIEAEAAEQEEADDDGKEPEETIPGEPEIPMWPVEAAALMAPPPLPDPQPRPAAPLPPPPVAREAAYHISITARSEASELMGPALVTIMQGLEPRQWLPATIAERVIEAIRARVEAVVMSDGAVEWLEVSSQ